MRFRGGSGEDFAMTNDKDEPKLMGISGSEYR